MAVRRVPIRPVPQQQQGAIDFKNIVRKPALEVRDVSEVSASTLYNLCRAKSNQVMMMKRRGYEITPDEETWLLCSTDENILILKSRTLLGMKLGDIIRNIMDKTYKMTKRIIPSQTAYTYYPYLTSESDETPKVGEFFFRNGKWEMDRMEEQITEEKTYTTEVKFIDELNPGDYNLSPHDDVSRRIVIFTGEEKEFKKEFENMVWYRRQGVEIFHISELYIDYFQHWLVPKQEIITDVDKVKLLTSHLMIRDEDGNFQKTINCKITEQGFPHIHYTDIVMRYIGALPGHIIYWECDSYISSFITKEFGYMLVMGHKYNTTKAEEQTFAGERVQQRPEEEVDESDNEEEEGFEDDEDEDVDVGEEDD